MKYCKLLYLKLILQKQSGNIEKEIQIWGPWRIRWLVRASAGRVRMRGEGRALKRQRGSGSIVSVVAARGSGWELCDVCGSSRWMCLVMRATYTFPHVFNQRISRWSRDESWILAVCWLDSIRGVFVFPVSKCNHLWITRSSCDEEVIWPVGRISCIYDPCTRLIDRRCRLYLPRLRRHRVRDDTRDFTMINPYARAFLRIKTRFDFESAWLCACL